MKPDAQKGDGLVDNFIVHYMLSFKHLCLVTVSCPLLALIICFVTAYIFQADDIHETHCRVRKKLIFIYNNQVYRCTILYHQSVQ